MKKCTQSAWDLLGTQSGQLWFYPSVAVILNWVGREHMFFCRRLSEFLSKAFLKLYVISPKWTFFSPFFLSSPVNSWTTAMSNNCFLMGDFYVGIGWKKAWELLIKPVVSTFLCIKSLGDLYLSRFSGWITEQKFSKGSVHAQDAPIPLVCGKWKGQGRGEWGDKMLVFENEESIWHLVNFQGLHSALLRLLATNYPHLCIVDDWICEEEITGTDALLRRMLLTNNAKNHSPKQLQEGIVNWIPLLCL